MTEAMEMWQALPTFCISRKESFLELACIVFCDLYCGDLKKMSQDGKKSRTGLSEELAHWLRACTTLVMTLTEFPVPTSGGSQSVFNRTSEDPKL